MTKIIEEKIVKVLNRSRTKTVKLTDDVLDFLEVGIGSELVFCKAISKHGKFCFMYNDDRQPITKEDL